MSFVNFDLPPIFIQIANKGFIPDNAASITLGNNTMGNMGLNMGNLHNVHMGATPAWHGFDQCAPSFHNMPGGQEVHPLGTVDQLYKQIKFLEHSRQDLIHHIDIQERCMDDLRCRNTKKRIRIDTDNLVLL